MSGRPEAVKCSNCVFFHPDAENVQPYWGLCRSRSPRMLVISESEQKTMWPQVGGAQWCGEFRSVWPGYTRWLETRWCAECRNPEGVVLLKSDEDPKIDPRFGAAVGIYPDYYCSDCRKKREA